MSDEHKVTPLKVASSQEDLSCQLLDTMRELCLDPKYDRMTVSTLIGVIELLKHEMLRRHAE